MHRSAWCVNPAAVTGGGLRRDGGQAAHRAHRAPSIFEEHLPADPRRRDTVAAARAASHAAGAAFLHHLADAHQVRHVLGAAAHAARAEEPVSGEDPRAAARALERVRRHAPVASPSSASRASASRRKAEALDPHVT